MMNDIFERSATAAAFINSHSPLQPAIGLILGSGLGQFADQLNASVALPYAQIPHFPQSTVEGHGGRLITGTFEGVPIAVMQGRVHGYEGYSPLETTFPVRVLAQLGIKTLIVTNASGGIRTTYRQGQIIAISDHINFTGQNPLVGPNDSRLGLRFFDMTTAYSPRLRRIATDAAAGIDYTLEEGVYLGLSGSSFETPAEIRAFRALGADLVGMSTVHEVIVARHASMKVLGLSCVTNMAAGILDQPLNHEEVMETGRRVQQDFTRLLQAIVPRLIA